MKKKYITNSNTKGELHGYQEWYYYGVLTYRGNNKNSFDIGYNEYHSIFETNYYIK